MGRDHGNSDGGGRGRGRGDRNDRNKRIDNVEVTVGARTPLLIITGVVMQGQNGYTGLMVLRTILSFGANEPPILFLMTTLSAIYRKII